MASLDSYDAIFDNAIAFVKQHGEQFGRNLTAPLTVALIESRAAIQSEYESLRDDTKENYMQSATEPLDRHKCVACFMISIVTALNTSKIERDPAIPRLIKEIIALEIGLSILITMIGENPDENAQIVEFLGKNDNRIVFPPVRCDDDIYLLIWARGLYYDRANKRLSVLSLSNTIFLIESFNWERAATEVAGKVFRQGF